ncbi:MAG: hypothetical protein KJ072_20160 [Verrucomicrobia bacterium]|nr:hypothetical protein [Verrucomicrobiota bacterium]
MRAQTDPVFGDFLGRQCQEGMALARNSDLLELMPLDGLRSSRYLAEFRCRGLIEDERGAIVDYDRFAVGIWFPEDYLRRVDLSQVVTYLGPAPRPWHPNINGPFICLHITPGTPLVDILYGCFELFTWNLKYTGDEGLNHAAAQWARRQEPARFPLDRRPLRRRALDLHVATEGGVR